MDEKSTCNLCDGSGMASVYHRHYRGHPDIYLEYVNGFGEVSIFKVPGIIAAHCMCPKGIWMRSKLKDEDLKRIPTLKAVFDLKTSYLPVDPTEEDAYELTASAKRFIDHWRTTFGAKRCIPTTEH